MAVLRTYSATVTELAPLARWRFGEAAGATAVDSAGGLDGTYRGSVALGQAGPTGSDAVRLGGNGSFVEIVSASGGSFAVDIAAFGDSLIAGFGLGAPSSFFGAQLEAALDARGLDSTVTAFGQNGRDTGEALGAVQGVIAAAPDVVVSVHGTNDSLNGVAPATTEANLRTMIRQFQAADIEVLLTGTFGLWPNETFGRPGYDTTDPANALTIASRFEAIFPTLAAEFGIALFEPFHGGARNGGQIVGGVLGDPSLNQGDGIHPNGAGVTQIVNRMLPQAMLVAAASGAIQAPTEPLLLANGTIELWFNADSVAGRQGLFSKDAAGLGTGGHLSALIDNGQVFVGIEGLSANQSGFVGGPVQAGVDTHLVFTFGAGGMRLFLNGQLVDANGFTGGLDIGVDGLGNFEPLVLGALIDGSPSRATGAPNSSFSGLFDELAIYDRALSGGEIQQLFAAGQQGGVLVGTAAADQLIGGADDDTLRGRDGADLLLGRQGDDNLNGGPGGDELRGGGGRDTIEGRLGGDSIFGGSGADDLRGNKGPDTIRGGAGADRIFGDKGPDDLRGGQGADLIAGGGGDDLLTGGPGPDRFVIGRLADGVDRILDFEVGAGRDVLDLAGVLRGFEPGTSDPLDFLRLHQTGGGTTVSVNADGAGADFTAVVELSGVAGPSLDQLLGNGNIEVT